MTTSRRPCAAHLRPPRVFASWALVCVTVALPAAADAKETSDLVTLEPAEETGDASANPSYEPAVQEAIDRAIAAEEAEDWPGAIEAYREAGELGLTQIEGMDLNEVIAKLHFAYGTALYKEAKYEEALRHFQDAQGLFPAPAFHFNIAKCQEELGKYEAAISSYQAFARGVPEAPANIENRIKRLEETLTLQEAQAEREAQENAERRRDPSRALIISGASLAGIGVVTGTVGAVVFGLQARERSDQVDTIVNGGNPSGISYDEALDLDKQGRRAEMLQFVMAAAGGAVTVAGAVLLAVGLKKKGEREAAETTALRFAPTFQRDHAGLMLMGRF